MAATSFTTVIAGLSRTNCLFRLHKGSIKKEQHVEFLKALRAHLKQPLLIIWDGLKAHRSRLVREYLDSTEGAVQMAFLPPYSPDLNPVEFLWAWLKRHALANFCPANLDELTWAFATRNHPERGLILFPDQPVLPLVAFLGKDERKSARATKALYNCLTPDETAGEAAPKRSSFRYLWPDDIQQRVLANWRRYGYE